MIVLRLLVLLASPAIPYLIVAPLLVIYFGAMFAFLWLAFIIVPNSTAAATFGATIVVVAIMWYFIVFAPWVLDKLRDTRWYQAIDARIYAWCMKDSPARTPVHSAHPIPRQESYVHPHQ